MATDPVAAAAWMPRAISQIALGIVVQVFAISCWFATAAALPSVTTAFDLDEAGRILLIACVQAGFAIGAVTVALARIADRVPPGILVPCGSMLTAGATVLPLVAADSFLLLCASRVLVGLLLAAVYPAGMRAMVSWASPRWRGLAVAGVVGALTVGTAAPQLLRASPIEDWRLALAVCAGAATVAALIGLLLREGPHVRRPAAQAPAHRRRAGPGPRRSPIQRRITIAYIGHMWEVYGLWVWLPALLVTVPGLGSLPEGLDAFLIIGIAGAVGCLGGGLLAARFGKRPVARCCAALSGACALAVPFLPLLSAVAVLLLLSVWSAAAIADSALYSALTGDVARPDRVGAAIALQMGSGYAVSIVVIALLPGLAALVGWPIAMMVLGVGPIAGVVVLRRWE